MQPIKILWLFFRFAFIGRIINDFFYCFISRIVVISIDLGGEKKTSFNPSVMTKGMVANNNFDQLESKSSKAKKTETEIQLRRETNKQTNAGDCGICGILYDFIHFGGIIAGICLFAVENSNISFKIDRKCLITGILIAPIPFHSGRFAFIEIVVWTDFHSVRIEKFPTECRWQ